MKKLFLFLMALCLLTINPIFPQGLLNRVKNAVSNKITGDKNSADTNNQLKSEPEPKCACSDAKTVFDLGGKLKIMHDEMLVYMKDDGSILVYDRMADKYYISKDGKVEGPYESTDQRVKDFLQAAGESSSNSNNESQNKDYWLIKYPSWISRSGKNT